MYIQRKKDTPTVRYHKIVSFLKNPLIYKINLLIISTVD